MRNIGEGGLNKKAHDGLMGIVEYTGINRDELGLWLHGNNFGCGRYKKDR